MTAAVAGRFAGHTPLVTGSGHHISPAIARLFAAQVPSVIVPFYRDAAKVEAAVEEIEDLGGAAFGLKADGSHRDQTMRLRDQRTKRFGDRADPLIAHPAKLFGAGSGKTLS